jgi:hydroxyacylglutathione hydrolase
MKNKQYYFLLIIFFFQFGCNTVEDFKVVHQVTGPISTNCYLIYGIKSKVAALVDPGWQIDTLVNVIKENNLKLKYIFVTHGHIDHIYYIPEIKNLFPNAKMCMNKDEYRDLFTAVEWITENYGKKWIEDAMSNPDTKKYMEFDMNTLGEPDIFVGDNQMFRLGNVKIHTLLSPGHSSGGICYYTGNIIFSGDVLFYRSVGTAFAQNGSKEAQIKSVRKLYELFPDSTIVYPGHGQFTDIGSEKTENKYITVDNDNMK